MSFTADLYTDPDSLFRGRAPRIARVRAIATNASLLRPTRSSMARAQETAAVTRPLRARAGKKRSLDEAADKENRQPARRRPRLTIPQSPKFQQRARRLTKEAMLTMTSRELAEIEAIRKRVAEMRKKNRRYHDATTRAAMPFGAANSIDKEAFSQALQSCGGLGVPAVRRQKLTEPKEFQFELDKRYATRATTMQRRGLRPSTSIATANTINSTTFTATSTASSRGKARLRPHPNTSRPRTRWS